MSLNVEATTLVPEVMCLAENVRVRSLNQREFHDSLQREIARLAQSYGVRAAREYPVIGDDGRGERIDVVWLSGRSPVAGFELDAARRKKSIHKLLSLGTSLRFWIYFGRKDGAAFLQTIDPGRSVHLVELDCVPRRRYWG